MRGDVWSMNGLCTSDEKRGIGVISQMGVNHAPSVVSPFYPWKHWKNKEERSIILKT